MFLSFFLFNMQFLVLFVHVIPFLSSLCSCVLFLAIFSSPLFFAQEAELLWHLAILGGVGVRKCPRQVCTEHATVPDNKNTLFVHQLSLHMLVLART